MLTVGAERDLFGKIYKETSFIALGFYDMVVLVGAFGIVVFLFCVCIDELDNVEFFLFIYYALFETAYVSIWY